ncbi:MAG: exonuclease domain-containing protein, partial [bacterium]
MYQGLYSPLLRQYMSKGEIPKLARVLADFTSHISGLEFDIEFREILFLNALESPIVVFDVETTGLHARLGDRIVEIGAIKVEGAQKISPCSVRRLTDRIPAGTMNRGLH